MLNRTFSIEQTKKNFSKVVWFYDYWGNMTESKAISEAISMSGISENQKVLEVGVGTGQMFKRILNENSKGFNFGIDLSKQMIAQAKEKIRLTKVIHLLSVGNAFNLPSKNQSFDFLFSSYVMDLLPETSFTKILNEFKRVLNSNGTGILITMSMGDNWYNKIWYLTAKYFPALLTNCRPVDLSGYLVSTGFNIVRREVVSQNTFPSEIIIFRKK